ncbi:MAG: S41 family peptidase [Burkholderiales bacterium]
MFISVKKHHMLYSFKFSSRLNRAVLPLASILSISMAGCGGGDNNVGQSMPPNPGVGLNPAILSGSVTVNGNPQPWSTVVTFDRPFTGTVNVGVVDTSGVIAPSSVTVTPQGGASYKVSMNTAALLGAGNYSGNLQLRACQDSVANCTQPLPGSPWQLPYSLTVLPSLASAENQCTSLDAQKTWVRSYVNEAYLWYRDVPTVNPANFSTPIDFFNALPVRTLTASGKPRDQFSFAVDSATWNATIIEGQSIGYGMQISLSDDGVIRVLYVEPESPAATAGVARGDTIVSINGQPLATLTDEFLSNVFLRPTAGQTYSFTVRSPLGVQRTFSMTSALVTTSPVLSTQVLNVGGAKIGYIVFNGFSLPAQDQLISAFKTLRNANIDDLVLDLRYNGGGFVAIASQLSYMIGGSTTEGKVFSGSRFNEKRINDNNDKNNEIGFISLRYDPNTQLETNTQLPTLGLNRVFVLTTGGTCSASESVINGLRGIDFQVITLGSTTCGKPYGFTGKENCGITYFPIEEQGYNAKGFGDYADGFAPNCPVADDLTRPLGDPTEGMLAAALSHRATGKCPTTSLTRSGQAAGSALPEARVLRSPLLENRYHLR